MPELGIDAGVFVLDESGEVIEIQIERLVEWMEWIDKWGIETVIPNDLGPMLLEINAPIYHDRIQEILDKSGSPFSAIDVEAVLWRFLTTSIEIGNRIVVDATAVSEGDGEWCSHAPCHKGQLIDSSKDFLNNCSWIQMLSATDFYGVVACPNLSANEPWTSVQDALAIVDVPEGVVHDISKEVEIAVSIFGDVHSLADVFLRKLPLKDHTDNSIAHAIHLESLRISRQIESGGSPTIKFTFARQFGESVRALRILNSPGDTRQFLRACAEAVLGINLDQSHRMRINSSGGSKPRRSSGGRYLNRRTINSASGLRLHSWDANADGIELATAAVHDDFAVPDPIFG